jgi:hypothetical protein
MTDKSPCPLCDSGLDDWRQLGANLWSAQCPLCRHYKIHGDLIEELSENTPLWHEERQHVGGSMNTTIKNRELSMADETETVVKTIVVSQPGAQVTEKVITFSAGTQRQLRINVSVPPASSPSTKAEQQKK